MKRLALTILFLLLASVAWATDYNVPSGSDLNLILKTANAGDNFILAPKGVYAGGCFISSRNGTAPTLTTPAVPITLICPTRDAVVQGSTTARPDGIQFYQCSWWVIDGVSFQGAANAGLRYGSCNNMVFRNGSCKNNTTHGMLGGNSNNCTIDHCLFAFTELQHHIYFSGAFTKCVVTNCTGSFAGRSFVQFNSQGTGGQVVTDCTISNCSMNNNGQKNEAAAINLIGVQGCTISGCTINDCIAGGIAISGNGTPTGNSDRILVNSCVITFRPGEGRACVQATGPGTTTVTNTRMWTGKPTTVVQAVQALAGATIMESGNITLPPAAPVTLPVGGGPGN